MGMETNWAAEQLQTIRTLMERSAVYRRALAPIMLFAGCWEYWRGSWPLLFIEFPARVRLLWLVSRWSQWLAPFSSTPAGIEGLGTFLVAAHAPCRPGFFLRRWRDFMVSV